MKTKVEKLLQLYGYHVHHFQGGMYVSYKLDEDCARLIWTNFDRSEVKFIVFIREELHTLVPLTQFNTMKEFTDLILPKL